jgi:hypothetical protein
VSKYSKHHISFDSMKNGETFHYKGERTRETLVDYAERMALPPIQVIGDSNTMKEKINSQQKFFLYVGDNIGSTWVSFQQRRFFMKSSQP